MRTILEIFVIAAVLSCSTAWAQLTDLGQTPNFVNEGIAKSLDEQIGASRGDAGTAGSSLYLIARDPFRSIRRGRQLFQRKFTYADGLGPHATHGFDADIHTHPALGAGFADSCAACHGRPRGAAGFGGVVYTRPDSRDAPHLFGLGLQEMLADEMTADLRRIRQQAISDAVSLGTSIRVPLTAKGVQFGYLTARPDGSIDEDEISGVDPDLRIKPFFAHGGSFSIRHFIVGALNDEMGLQAPDPDVHIAADGGRVVTPSGFVLDGSLDRIAPPPAIHPFDDADQDGVYDEIDVALVDHLEFYLLNYFKPAIHEQTTTTELGRRALDQFECTRCHIPSLTIEFDRRVADVETRFDPGRGVFNRLFATARPLFHEVVDHPALPPRRQPNGGRFVVENFFSDLKRHDLGPEFWERNFDGSFQRFFVTEPLWGVGSTAPYGHDGRSINLHEVILRHGGDARRSRDRYAAAPANLQAALRAFLESLVLFPPDDTASNLGPGDPLAPAFPQQGHGGIRLSTLFLDPSDPE
jgi:hypothetical protein